jgi:hypothetical protein
MRDLKRWVVCSTLLSFVLAWSFARRQPACADEEPLKLRAYAASVDRAVDKALVFLARNQAANPAHDGSFGDWNGETNAVTGLVGMAFLAKGYRPGAPPYGDVINATIDYILATEANVKQQAIAAQKAAAEKEAAAAKEGAEPEEKKEAEEKPPPPPGYLGSRGGKMYGHGIATLYLSEVSGMVDTARQEKIDVVLGRALKVILEAQKVPKTKAEENGGWRYEPDSKDSDISVTGWCLMALRSARLNGAPVSAAAIRDAVGFIDRCRRSDDGGFRYNPAADWWYARRGYWVRNHSSSAKTAAALLCRELTGHHADEVNRAAADYLIKALNPGDLLHNGKGQPEGHHAYATYYAAQGMFQLGGQHWEQFGEAMYQYLLAKQQSNGAWYREGKGEVYPTAMYTLALTVSYRQLPIYQR